MKRSAYFNLLLVSLALFIGSTGCKMKPKSPTPIPSGSTRNVGGDDGTFGATTPGMTVPGEQGTGVDANRFPGGPGGPGGIGDQVPLITGANKEDAEIFKANMVFFAFDRADVRPGERSKIEAVASHLKANPTHMVRVEGHCDERGTEGYNLSLGDRRALAVRTYIINLGISADRIATLSYGEARPSDPGHSEAAWAKNRRGEFILLTP